jgi:zinc finger protein 830
MADVRTVLRQHRAARRIDHPQAAYSDAGKLLCTVCHEHIKTESLWDGHVSSAGHQQRLQSLQSAGKAANGHATADGAAQSQKRKHGDDDDEEMAGGFEEEAVRKKRSKQDMATREAGAKESTEAGKDKESLKGTPTPAPLLRRASGAPAQGVEMQIPSRPATPVAGREGSSTGSGASVSSTPKVAPTGRSPLIPQGPMIAVSSALATTADATATPGSTAAQQQQHPTANQQSVDEDEWAAFEADVVRAPTALATVATGDAVISAPAMTAEEAAARSQEEERERRRALADVEIEDEREEATRALETEFEEMEELEARVRRLKERREALRQQGRPAVQADSLKGAAAPADGKENANGGAVGDEEESEDEDEDEEDDWAGFRFRG